MKPELSAQAIFFAVCFCGGVALAQTTPVQQASDTAMSERHRYAHPSAADKALANQIHRQLVHTKGIDASEVMVGVKDGTVLLRGRLDNAEQREQVESVVKAVPGVKSVDNQLTVQPTD
ncbi:BON domain-containing protein [Trinickia terrae]|nr:BON domain-containing protein [Trinickia terrae]